MKPGGIILIIDDSSADRRFFKDAIQEIDPSCEVRQAINGVEGLKQLRELKPLPNFIFLDLNMPMMNGQECLAEIMKDDVLKSIPVIIYTTGEYENNKHLVIEGGAASFLSKPWAISDIPLEIRRVLEEVEIRLQL